MKKTKMKKLQEESKSQSNEEKLKKTKKSKKDKNNSTSFMICPNYELFSEENLKEQMRNYGLKPGSNRAMIKSLKEIFEFRKTSKKLIIFKKLSLND
jgi:hypothetical protein